MAEVSPCSAAQKMSILHSLHVRLLIVAVTCSLALFAHPLCGQAAGISHAVGGPAQRAFSGYDVVSIKPNVSGSGSMRISARETTFQATNTSLKMMLVNAYGIRDTLILGLPKWAEAARWDINAKIVDPPPEDKNKQLSPEQSTEQYRTKVQSILTDRFQIRVHKETRILPIYELVVMPGSLHLKKSEPAEEEHSGMSSKNDSMTGTAVSLDSFAFFLSNLVGRTVIDKTALQGTYDFTLKWSPDELAETAKETGAGDRPPQIYTALQEQLGLRLVSSKGPSEVLVVDSVEQPTVD